MFKNQNKPPREEKAPAFCVRVRKQCRIRRRRRHGMTLIETIAAAALLLVALGLGMKVIVASSSAEQAAQRKALATEILSNLLEEKMALPISELTKQEAAKWKAPFEAELLLTKAELESEVTSVTGPLAGKKVTLKLTWQETSGQRTAPLILSAWAFSRPTGEMSP